MAQRMMGLETEYAIAAPSDPGWIVEVIDRQELVHNLMGAARRTLAHLPDFGEGLFICNGSRLYIDYGLHPELGTPECLNPWDAVRYVLAGERILHRLVENVGGMVFKCNVDYSGSFTTWGCHESYLHRCVDLARLSRELIPHLVSRVIFTGAGGFDPFSKAIEFTLSPRAAHLNNDVSTNSTSDRGIFHTKDESLSKAGYHRLHLICGETLCSETAMWLKVATTALVVAMAEAGLNPGQGVELATPVRALRSIASDSTCSSSVRMATGRYLSAVEIQDHYLTLAERHAGDSFMPAWAERACTEWRAMLNRLLDAPASVETTLDWAIKRALYGNHVNKRGFNWTSLWHWLYVIREAANALEHTELAGRPLTLGLLSDKTSPISEAASRLRVYLEQHGLELDQFDSVMKLRRELFEIDTKFGQVGEDGIFNKLDRAGVLSHHFEGVDNVDHAASTPPDKGRARVRGEAIRRLSGRSHRYQCSWEAIVDAAGRKVMDLSDPFESEERWAGVDQLHPDSPLWDNYYARYLSDRVAVI